MTFNDETALLSTVRPQGRLRAGAGPLPWLMRWGSKTPHELRPAMCGALLSSPGSVVLGDVPSRCTVAGVPAKPVGGRCAEPSRTMDQTFPATGEDS